MKQYDDVVERSKTPDLGSGPIQGVGSNPTVINTFFFFIQISFFY